MRVIFRLDVIGRGVDILCFRNTEKIILYSGDEDEEYYNNNGDRE